MAIKQNPTKAPPTASSGARARALISAYNKGIAAAVSLLLFYQSDLAPRVNALMKKVPE